MAYMTTELITSSYYTSGVVSREFETVSGGQVADGLTWLNEILGEKAIDQSMVPYETTYSGTFIVGQKTYSIPNLVQIDTLVFYLDDVRYAMAYDKRNNFFGSSRVENIQTLPFEWYFERQFGGGILHIYFAPDRAYPFEVHGVFRMSSVALGQDLSLTLDEFYRTYLHYALSDRICSEYNYTTPPNVLRQLGKYESWIAKKSRILDLRISKVSTLQKNGSYGWAFINLGKGFTKPG